MRIAVAGSSYNESHIPQISALLKSLIANGDEIFIYEDIYASNDEVFSLGGKAAVLGKGAAKKGINLFLSIGGDGTLLNSIGVIRDSCVPVLGINTGRMGYLTSATLPEAGEAIERFRRDEYLIDRRSLLRAESSANIFSNSNFALNDFTIFKKDSASMITVQVHVNGVFLNSYWGDGLIISTPTGSTAYSMSCGGPIVSGECGVFIITPVAPHNLNVRPLVISDSSVITISAETRQSEYLAALDSRSVTVDAGTEFTVKKEDFCINLVHFKGQSFSERIRNKLHWGLDKRN